MNLSFHIRHKGLRTLYLPSNSSVAYCGIAVHAGTRNETPQQQGLAHFCEHLAFKGTTRRTTLQIINAIEGLGGELNAFTNKEDTVFYCAVEQRYLRRALDLLQDIVFNSQYPQQEVEKEREVVCDEIESYEDSPAELIYDEFENLLFEGHPLGHNILGNSERVRAYSPDDARAFTSQWYRPERCVLFSSLSHNPFSTVDPEVPFSLDVLETPVVPVATTPSQGVRILHRGTHQAHVMTGTVAYAANDPRRWALVLLSNILGGPAMNSRLSLSLRERHGLVYTVESSMTSYSDTGVWSIYFGCDQHDTKRCLRLVRHELDQLIDKPLTDTQLRAAKRQLQGQLTIACENREQYTLDCARTFLHTGRVRTLSDVIACIDRLTAHDLHAVAFELFAPERMTTLIYQ